MLPQPLTFCCRAKPRALVQNKPLLSCDLSKQGRAQLSLPKCGPRMAEWETGQVGEKLLGGTQIQGLSPTKIWHQDRTFMENLSLLEEGRASWNHEANPTRYIYQGYRRGPALASLTPTAQVNILLSYSNSQSTEELKVFDG